jgi:hypothetical protein
MGQRARVAVVVREGGLSLLWVKRAQHGVAPFRPSCSRMDVSANTWACSWGVSSRFSAVPYPQPLSPRYRYLMERVCVNLMRGCATLPSTDDAVFSSLTMLTQLRPDTTELVAPRIAAVRRTQLLRVLPHGRL